MVEDPDEALYTALQELNEEWRQNTKRIKDMAAAGALDHNTLVLELTETLMPLMTDFSERLCEACAPPDEDEEEEDEEDGDEGEEIGSGLIPEDAATFEGLLSEYREFIEMMHRGETDTEKREKLSNKLNDIRNAITLINDITLELDEEDEDEPPAIGQA
jgi:hypothetical protein